MITMFANSLEIDTTDNINVPTNTQISYTTAEIEMIQFYGELSNSFVSIESVATVKSPITYLIIDGKPKVIIDGSPKRAVLPNYESCFFEIT